MVAPLDACTLRLGGAAAEATCTPAVRGNTPNPLSPAPPKPAVIDPPPQIVTVAAPRRHPAREAQEQEPEPAGSRHGPRLTRIGAGDGDDDSPTRPPTTDHRHRGRGPTVPRRRSTRGAPQSRLRVGFVLIAMVLSVFGARLVQLQGVDPGSYAAMAAAEGTVEVVLPAERGDILDRNGEPLADSVDGLMVVADPAQTAEDAPAIARFLAERLSVDYIDTLARLRDRGSRFEYIARRVPSTLAHDVLDRGRGPRHRGALDRARPGPHLPGPRRGRQPDRLHGHRRGVRRPRAGLRQAPVRHGRLGPLRGRRRHPDPAGHQRDRGRGRRVGPDHDHRPRPAVVHPAGAPRRGAQGAAATPGSR